MRHVVRFLVLAVALALAAARGGEEPKVKMPVEESRKVRFPFYDDATGDLAWEVLAVKVTAEPNNPRVLQGTDVRIVVYRDGKPQTATGKKGAVNTETRSATLEGDVVIDFTDEQATRVETNDLSWDSKVGTAWTKGPAKITRTDATVTGTGLRLWLSNTKDAAGHAERSGHLVIEQRARSELLPGTNAALLQPGARDAKEPIIITCDGSLTLYRTEMTAIYRDNVRAAQGKQILTCDLLTVEVKPVPGEKGKAELARIVATGRVRLDDTRTVAIADTAEWSREQGSVKLTGHPAEIRWDNGNRIAAGLIHRMGDGAEVVCSATPEHPQRVYLLAYNVQTSRESEDEKDTPPGRLRIEDVLDWPGLSARLVKEGAAGAPSVGARVWALLPADTRSVLQSAAQGTVLGQKRKAVVVAALNEMLKRPDFYRAQDFAGVALPPEAAELLKRDLKTLPEDQLRRLNRALLHAACPREIAKAREPKPEAGRGK